VQTADKNDIIQSKILARSAGNQLPNRAEFILRDKKLKNILNANGFGFVAQQYNNLII
jgi:hypothetical protein